MQTVWVKYLKTHFHWFTGKMKGRSRCKGGLSHALVYVLPNLHGGIESTVIITEGKTNLEGTISRLKEKSRTQNYIKKLAGKTEKKKKDEIQLQN